MKRTVFILCIALAFISCKKDVKKEEQTVNVESEEKKEFEVLEGEFVYFSDAAVLQTNKEVYGVVIDEMMHELDKQVASYKKEPTDMVPVAIKGKVFPKPEEVEGWPYRVEIKEIIKIYEPKPEENTVIKLSN